VTLSNPIAALPAPRKGWHGGVEHGAINGKHMRRVFFAALIFATPVCPVSAQDAKVSVDMIGIGGMSCAHWRSTQEYRLEGTVWIYGFWTGLNYVAAASDQTQAHIDMAAIVAEVKKTCARQASQTLASAAWTTYLEEVAKTLPR
jgi:hypothetical protein